MGQAPGDGFAAGGRHVTSPTPGSTVARLGALPAETPPASQFRRPRMHNLDLIVTLAGGFILALTLGYLTHRLGWSPIVGYLLAGVWRSPHAGLRRRTAHGRAVGRSRRDSADVRCRAAFPFEGSDGGAKHRRGRGACAKHGGDGAGALVFHSFGWSWSQGIVFGLALSVASTVVLVRVLSDNGELQSPTGRDRRRLAGDGRHLHGFRAGAAAGHVRRVRRSTGRAACRWPLESPPSSWRSS